MWPGDCSPPAGVAHVQLGLGLDNSQSLFRALFWVTCLSCFFPSVGTQGKEAVGRLVSGPYMSVSLCRCALGIRVSPWRQMEGGDFLDGVPNKPSGVMEKAVIPS